MSEKQRIQCPRCGTPMNHHADKLVAPTDESSAANADPVFGGVIQETHTCPACAAIEFRRARPSPS
jgi:ribosomal protein S27AE